MFHALSIYPWWYEQPQESPWHICGNKMSRCNRRLFATHMITVMIYVQSVLCFLNFLTILMFVFLLYYCTSMSMVWRAITVFFFAKYLREDGQKRLKHVGLPYVCILLYLVIM
jgi:hypothetical protein